MDSSYGNFGTSVDVQTQKLLRSIKRVEKWVEDHEYRGYEPFDGLSSFLSPLTFNTNLLERILLQSVRRCPVNVRPIIGVKEKESTKGRGYMASGYLIMYKVTKNPRYLERAIACLEWLDLNRSSLYVQHSWGNHFPFVSRTGKLPAFEPIIVWTGLIGQAYLDAYEVTGETRFLDIVRNICDWILALPREITENGLCFSYFAPRLESSIHNANMLGAGVLARAFLYLKDPVLLSTSKMAMEYSCSRQHEDGAWWYGESPNLHWVDNFHTAYNLDSLKCYIDSSGDRDYDSNLKKGFEYYKSHFFLANGTPKYYHSRTYPVDSQCASQSIETLANFSSFDDDSLGLALIVANWVIDHMQDNNQGYFYFRRYPLGIIDKTPMLHWGQATMYKGLSLLYSKLTVEVP